MTRFIEADSVFKHHQPLTLEALQGFTIFGGNGAFRGLVSDSGEDPNTPTVGVAVVINTSGEIMGTKLLMCGAFPEVKLNTADLFPQADSTGKAVFQKSDMGNWVMPNGRMTSMWTRREDNAVNWGIKVNTGGRSKAIKFPKHGDYGFGDVSFRVNVQPTSIDYMKVTLGVAPVGGEQLEKIRDFNSRKCPVISMCDVRANIFPKESEGQHLGLGFQPILVVSGAESGTLDLDTLNYPTSTAIKEAAVCLLQSSTKPNSRLNAQKWQEALDNEEYVAETTTLLWPAPRLENEENTSDSAASVDTDGEKSIFSFLRSCFEL